MKLYPLFACAALVLLGACSTFRGTEMAYGTQTPMVSGFTPIATEPLPFNFCRASAANDRLRAASHGFDTPTLERIAAQSLAQCSVIVAGYPVETFRVASR